MADDSPEARKAELLDRVRATHTRLERALAGLSPAQLEADATVGGWSVKATLGHITWWEQVALHALRGEPDENILPGEEWDTDRANAILFERNRVRALDDVLTAFGVSYAELLRALEAMDPARLDKPGPYGDPLYELLAGNTFQHYDEHAAAIEATFAN
jgi:uncharacterized damage-inducible protein DinB